MKKKTYHGSVNELSSQNTLDKFGTYISGQWYYFLNSHTFNSKKNESVVLYLEFNKNIFLREAI